MIPNFPQKLSQTLLVAAATLISPASLPALDPDYQLQFSTYLGGSRWDHARDAATDSQGNVIIVGGTAGNFPVTPGAFDTQYNDGDGVSNRLEYLLGLDPNDESSTFRAWIDTDQYIRFSPDNALVNYELKWSNDLAQPIQNWSRYNQPISGTQGTREFMLPDFKQAPFHLEDGGPIPGHPSKFSGTHHRDS